MHLKRFIIMVAIFYWLGYLDNQAEGKLIQPDIYPGLKCVCSCWEEPIKFVSISDNLLSI